ncbi:MAG: hypothetical protein FIA92_16010 [Chloroflexi bacterium]|nr:hypothetical protein [Chloroflexota bacterium]
MARECPWCSTPATDEAATCGACGAALAQREAIGDLQIPGVTSVDPALQDFDKRPLHLRGPSPSQGLASGVIVAAAAGGPIGLAALGGIAAVAAAEYAAASRGPDGQPLELDAVGRPSEAVLEALRRLEAESDADAETDADAEADADAGPDPAASLSDPWADLPPSPAAPETSAMLPEPLEPEGPEGTGRA